MDWVWLAAIQAPQGDPDMAKAAARRMNRASSMYFDASEEQRSDGQRPPPPLSEALYGCVAI